MTIYPQLKVEIAFQNDPYAASPAWTDVTRHVRGDVSAKRGRNYEQSKNEAGTAALTLENLDGRFSPLNPSSPYYPYVLPYRPIRITASDASGTVYPIFRGFVERWPQKWSSGGNYGTVDITAVDGEKPLLGRTLGPIFTAVILNDNPSYFYIPDSGTSGLANRAESILQAGDTAGTSFTGSGTFTAFTAAGLIAGSPLVAEQVTSSGTNYELSGNTSNASGAAAAITGGSGYTYAPTGDYAIEAVYRPDVIPTDSTHADVFVWITQVPGSPPGAPNYLGRLRVQFGATAAAATYTLALGGTPTSIPITPAAPVAGRADHFVITRVGSTTSVYQNGTLIGTSTASYGAPINGSGGSSFLAIAASMTTAATYKATVGAFALYRQGLTAAQVTNHYDALTRAREFTAATAGVRIGQVLDSIGWPAGLRSLALTGSRLQATGSLSGTSALTVLQAAAGDELGNVFVDAQGRVVFQNRAARNSPTSVATFGEAAGEVPYLEGVTVDFDDTYVFNDIQITQAGTSPVVVAQNIDLPSQATYGVAGLPITANLANVADVAGMSTTLLARYKQPVARLSSLPVDIKANTAAINRVLSRELGDLVTVKRRPIGAPAISLDAFVDGIEDKISTDGWTRSFLLTPKFANSTY